jgi:cystathionine beta-synthase
MNVVKDILESIGNTPLIKLRKVTEGLQREIYVKCEYLNPSGSIKDRIALRMVSEAERGGRLRPGGTIIEQTTGNTGPALAFVGGVKESGSIRCPKNEAVP